MLAGERLEWVESGLGKETGLAGFGHNLWPRLMALLLMAFAVRERERESRGVCVCGHSDSEFRSRTGDPEIPKWPSGK